MKKLLLVDDAGVSASVLAHELSAMDFDVHVATGVDDAMVTARRIQPDVAIVETFLGERPALELVRILRAICPSVRIVVYSAFCGTATTVDALRLGAADVLDKPAPLGELVSAVAPERARATARPERRHRPMSFLQHRWGRITGEMVRTGNNVSATARNLGMQRRSLQRMLRKPRLD